MLGFLKLWIMLEKKEARVSVHGSTVSSRGVLALQGITSVELTPLKKGQFTQMMLKTKKEGQGNKKDHARWS